VYKRQALLKAVYKLISSIINRRLAKALNDKFHDGVHGFRAGRGTGTAIIEAKLLMQLAQRSNKPLYMVFMDLKKAYDTLDRDRTMEILEGYGVGVNLRRFIERIWGGDTMVPKQSGFFGKPFRAGRGVRQGDIISPIIFNVVCDAVIREWEAQMNNGGVRERKETCSQFYADDGLLSGGNPQEVQRSMDIFTNVFARVGLQMNVIKTKAMTMIGSKVYASISDEAYVRRVTGEGTTYRERSLQKVECELCGGLVCRQYMTNHQQTKKCESGRKEWAAAKTEAAAAGDNEVAQEQHDSEPELETVTMEYAISMPKGHNEVTCPVRGCRYKTDTRTEMRRHFRARHLEDTIVIAEEGKLPRCDNCGLFQRNVGQQHKAGKDCKKATRTRKARKDAKLQKTAREVVFMVEGRPIENVKEFKYLGRILEENDQDWPAVQRNLKRARQKWGMIGRILSREGANEPRTMATFYKAIIQSVLLYGSETWVLTKRMMQNLRSFHQRCARHITGRNIRKDEGTGEWICPDSETTLRVAGLWTIEEYIERRKRTVMKYARERYIYRRCVNSRPVANSTHRGVWWDCSTNYLADDA
jgi:hypothetical protein